MNGPDPRFGPGELHEPGEPEPSQSCRGQYQRVNTARSPLVELPQPCVEIPADRCESGARQQPGELGDAADAAGPDGGGLAEAVQDVFDARQG